MKKAIGYIRVSTEQQADEGVSLAAQRAKITAWSELNDYELVAIYEDAGISGKTVSKRPQLQMALAEMKKGMALVVYSLSILARSTDPVLTAKSKLAEVLNGLLGRELTIDEINSGYDVDTLVGKDCNVLVLNNKGKNGAVYSNVERIFQAEA